MHFSRWMRKNSKQIMVFVVIFSMLSFILGYAGLQLFFSIFGGSNPVVGTYSDGQKIQAREFMEAQGQLRLLRMLWADQLLLAQGQQGLAGPLTAYLLFPDSQGVSEMTTELVTMARQGQLPFGPDKIEAFFSERPQAEISWILLKAEAAKAGIVVSDQQSRTLLQQLLPQLAQGQDPVQMMNAILVQTNLSEGQIVRIFADLLGVITYVSNITDSHSVTLNQVQAEIGRSHEKLNAEFVQIPAEWFIDMDRPVSDEELTQQFEAYRDVVPGRFTRDNPFGFGYKQPKRVRLEYMAVLLDDVKTRIDRPTAENFEDFYSRNIEQFRYEEPVDPDDPDGAKVTQTRSFAEVLPQIRNAVEQERTARLAGQIFNDARAITEEQLAIINVEQADFEQLAGAAGDYTQAATELSNRYNISVKTGLTGLLSAEDFGNDSILQGLRLQTGQTAVGLADVVFAVERNTEDMQRRIGLPSVRPWENIGPIRGGYYDESAGRYYPVMTMVRVVEINAPSVPETMDVTYDVKGMTILPDRQEQAAVHSLADRVANDVRRVKAMETAQSHAERLAALAEEQGWPEAIAAYNAEHAVGGQQAALKTIREEMRLSGAEVEMYRRYMTTHPASGEFLRTRLKDNALYNQLYALLPQDEQETGTVFDVLVVREKEAAYVARNVSRTPATEADYLENKMMKALQVGSQVEAELALIHLKPTNLFARMGYVAEDLSDAEATERMPVLPEGEF